MGSRGNVLDPHGDPAIRTSPVTPDFFRTMGIRPVLGRLLTERDSQARVGVINQTLARHYFGNGNPIGQMIYFPRIDAQNRYILFGTQVDPVMALHAE